MQVTESQYFIFHANSLSLLPGTDCRLGALRAAKCCFSGTDHRFGALRAAKCCFSGTAADRLSWSAATARRYGGLCAMALLAAAVASRCSESGHGYSGPNDTYAPSVLTSNRVLSAFRLSRAPFCFIRDFWRSVVFSRASAPSGRWSRRPENGRLRQEPSAPPFCPPAACWRRINRWPFSAYTRPTFTRPVYPRPAYPCPAKPSSSCPASPAFPHPSFPHPANPSFPKRGRDIV